MFTLQCTRWYNPAASWEGQATSVFFRPLDLTDAGLFIFDLKPSGAWRGLT